MFCVLDWALLAFLLPKVFSMMSDLIVLSKPVPIDFALFTKLQDEGLFMVAAVGTLDILLGTLSCKFLIREPWAVDFLFTISPCLENIPLLAGCSVGI
jgi:hypothetical protein